MAAPPDHSLNDIGRYNVGYQTTVNQGNSSRKHSNIRPSKIATNINLNADGAINQIGTLSGANTGSNSKIAGPAKSPYMPSRDAARLLKKRQGS